MHRHFRLISSTRTWDLPYQVTFKKLIDCHNHYLPDKLILRKLNTSYHLALKPEVQYRSVLIQIIKEFP